MHITHFEDLIIIKQKEGLKDIFNILKLLKIKPSKESYLSEKIDGAPAIFFGYNHLGEFFVSTKRIFKKTPEIFTTEKEIKKAIQESALVDKLTYALKYLSKIINTTSPVCFGGDLLFTEKSKREIEEGIFFKPNVIEYVVTKDSPFYDKVRKAKIGIATHSQFDIDEFNNVKRSSTVDFSLLQEDTNVFWVDPYIREDLIITRNLNLKLIKEKLEKLITNISNDFWNILQQNNSVKDVFLRYTVFTGNENREMNYDDFIQWIDNHDKISNKVKKIINDLEKKDVKYLFKTINFLLFIKNTILNTLYSSLPGKVGKTYYNENIFNVEGYVVNYENGIVKLVDRKQYSKINREKNQNNFKDL